MGKESNVMCSYLSDNARFADLFNANFFHGKQVVRPGELEDISEKYVEEDIKNNNFKSSERIRDVQKRMKSGGTLRILAIENQSQVDYTMPWRCMNYDSLEYGKQIKEIKRTNTRNNSYTTSAEKLCGFLKSDRINPVYTICLYHGKEPWDGPRRLFDMIDFGEDASKWQSLFTDYQLRLICMNEPTNTSYFHTELGLLFAVLPLHKDKVQLKQLISKSLVFHSLDKETMEVMAVLTNNHYILDNIDQYENDGGGYNMCEALEGIKEDGRLEGADLKLIEWVCKKLAKNKSPYLISEELEEDFSTIQDICKIALTFAPNYDCKEILKIRKPEYTE